MSKTTEIKTTKAVHGFKRVIVPDCPYCHEEHQHSESSAFIGPGVAHLADMMSELLISNDAKNYVCFELAPRIDRGLRPILVTVQWRNGKSPAQARDELLVILQRVEWVTDTNLQKYCPICECEQEIGHNIHCELDAVLKSTLKQKIEE